MAESVFDQRYRYDYIYPRGRSGETLRAVDLQDADRPVVIKRPAPHDAPPIRYGQEVSILNERKALVRLAGHPAITALLNTGQFTVSGATHQYIVMERAEGTILAEVVLEYAARGERLPELEMLTILDHLLDLLANAHSRDIVYNDVDAKHLFWDRDSYRLKVIDWGNAVFLEGDESTPQGISRQSDIFQIGELLYFVLTGGGRMERAPANAGDDFRVNFGHEADRVPARLQAIISRAAHPNPRARHASLSDLRKELADYRAPLERDRNAVIGRINDRLRRDLSRDDLNGLTRTLEPALAIDPGFPAARAAAVEIQHRLVDLEVAADLDAARIYLQSANWTRAAALLEELRPRARGETAALIALLSDWCVLLIEQRVHPTPAAVSEAIKLLFERHFDRAAVVLLTQGQEERENVGLQLLLAERISAQMSDVLLLRPSLYRLEIALAQIAADSDSLQEPRALLREIQAALDNLSQSGTANLNRLRDGFRAIVEQLTALNSLVESAQIQRGLTNRQLPATTLSRALNAAMGLADNMHIIGKQAVEDPRDAGRALDNSRAIDPANTAWDAVARVLRGLYDLLNAYRTYLPSADGADVADWLVSARHDLQPFVERLFDETLVSMVFGLELASTSWKAYADAAVQGNRGAALLGLSQASDAVSVISPALANWLAQLRAVVGGASYIERHALYGGLGRALADGWESFDRSRLAESERLGKQAFDAARDDPERNAARRLRDLVEMLRDWVERGAVADLKRTQTALATVELLYTPDEIGARDAFSAQMPSKETFIKAMSKGLVDNYNRQSTAASRILFANFALWGALDAHDNRLDDARFWRDAAAKVLGDFGARHAVVRALEDYIDRRHDVTLAAALMNSITNASALAKLESSRKALEENPQARLLTAAHFSLRELEAALRDWSDGEFRAAGIKLENAARAIDEAEAQAGFTLTNYRAFVRDLLANAADLHQNGRKIAAAVENRHELLEGAGIDALRMAHRHQADVTGRLLGESYAATLRGWVTTLDQIAAVYLDKTMRRSAKLIQFSEVFQTLFIDRHPAYALYRRWQDAVEASPEFPPPPTGEPTPRLTEDEAPLPASPADARPSDGRRPDLRRGAEKRETTPLRPIPPIAADGTSETAVAPDLPSDDAAKGVPFTLPDVEVTPAAAPRRRLPLPLIAVGLGIIALVIALIVTNTPPNDPGTQIAASATEIPPSESPSTSGDAPTALPFIAEGATEEASPALTLTADTSPTPPMLLATVPPRGDETPTNTRPPSETPLPSATFTASPTLTLTPSNTPTATAIPSITPTLRATLPPDGLRGDQSILVRAASEGLTLGDAETFAPLAENPETWRFGTGEMTTGGEAITLMLDSAAAEQLFGADAARRIAVVETRMTLRTWNPVLMIDNEVFFGMTIQNGTSAANAIGLEVRLVREGVIRLGIRSSAGVATVSERAVSDYDVTIRLEYDPTAGTVQIWFEDAPVGQPIALGANAQIVPVLLVREGGVIVYVDAWDVRLR
jgi:hypothetical protein